MFRNIAIFFLLLLSPNTTQPQISRILKGTKNLSNSLKGAKAYPKWEIRGPTMNKQLNHHKADIWACQSSGRTAVHLWGRVLKESRKITQTQHACCAWGCCDDNSVIMGVCKGQQTTGCHTERWSVFGASWSSTYIECIRDKSIRLLLLYLSVKHVCLHRISA